MTFKHRPEKGTKKYLSASAKLRSTWTDRCFQTLVKRVSEPTLQFGVHGDVGEAAQHGNDLIVLVLAQVAQHIAPLRVLEAHQVLQRPNFVLGKEEEEEEDKRLQLTRVSSKTFSNDDDPRRTRRYLLGHAVAEVLLLKVRQLQQRRLGLLQALHDHLRQLHAVLDGDQPRGVKTCHACEKTADGC